MGRRKKKSIQSKILISVISAILIVFAILGIGRDKSVQTLNVEENSNSKYLEIYNNAKQKNNLQVHFLNVGQADSILVENNGQVMLIDAGNNEDGDGIVNYIKELGITKIDILIGTHPHEDHIGGLDDVIKSFEIGKIYMPKMQTNTKTFEDVLDVISSKNLKIIAPSKGDTFTLGNANCKVMTDSIEDSSNLNLSSIVVELNYKNEKYLFMGDAETKNENSTIWEKVDVLKVGHHGSSTSSGNKFLEQIKSEIAIISVGKGNTYNLPNENTLTRISKVCKNIYRTDIDGTIIITTDGQNNVVNKVNKMVGTN